LLFNSYPFVFGFLPIALLGYQLAAHFGRRAVVGWLAIASLGFYAWWKPAFLIVLGTSIVFNYAMACMINRRIPNRIPTSTILTFAIVADLGALCYYKYLFPTMNFFADQMTGHDRFANVALPLGISFFTFTQIAYLVDLQESDEPGGFHDHTFADYVLFATFFPHLIAGPIYHHAEIMPQFQQNRDYRLRADDLAVGFSWFIMGLLKKVLLADKFSLLADPAFATPHSLDVRAAWVGSLCYALQLYFDFSGYSDMALGLARMFSIDFPLNFSSPYKATNIIDFWQRWHMTLTRYITLYIYNPVAVRITRWRVAHGLKASRKAMQTPSGFAALIATPTIITLLLAGIWHGAGMQFIAFGLLHALYLCINHAWRLFRSTSKAPAVASGTVSTSSLTSYLSSAGSCLLTFSAVLLAQIFFRASSMSDAFSYLAALAGRHSASAIAAGPTAFHPARSAFALIAMGFIIVWCFPNTQQILANFKPALEVTSADRKPALISYVWRPNAAWGLVLGIIFFAAVIKMQDPSSFLYFQF
jgi:D-alanyl-lipoteichoic acid acyltransferase DltB (MBOAT superfamily)